MYGGVTLSMLTLGQLRRRREGADVNSETMLDISSVLILLTAVGGVLMAGIRFRGHRNPPSWLALMHGLLAGAGLTLLAYVVLLGDAPVGAVVAAVLFVLAAAGGVVLNLAYHNKNRPLPKGLTLAHAALATVAFVLLVAASWG